MKIFTSFLLLLAITLFSFNGSPAQCGVFYDGFESGSLSPSWLGGTGYTRTVTTSNPALGNYCLDHTGSSSHYQGSYVTFAPFQPDYFAWWVRSSSVSTANAYFVIGDASMTSNNGILFSYITSPGILRFYASSTVTYTYNVAVNTWYHVEIKNVNWTAKTFDIYVNGVLGYASFPFRSQTSNDVSQFHIYNLSSVTTAKYDEIQIGMAGATIDSMLITDQQCFGDSTGAIDISVTSPNGTPTYSWSTGDTTQDIGNLLPGTYSVSITDTLGCNTMANITVSGATQIVTSDTTWDPLCNGQATGSIDLLVSGGNPGYNYNWSTGDTLQDVSGLAGGTYTVVVTDMNGCQVMDTFIINEPAPMVSSGTFANPPCFGEASGSVNVVVTGGTAPYTYYWPLTQDTVANPQNMPAGNYIVTIFDDNGCQIADTFYLTQPTEMISSGTVTDEDQGMNNGAIDVTVSGGTPGYTYNWSNGDTTQDLTNIASGTYIVTITDGNGCENIDTFVVGLIIGISQQPDLELRAWPNPFSDGFSVEIPGTESETVRISIMDLNGKLLWREEVSGAHSKVIQLKPGLAAGSYFLRAEAAGGSGTIMLIKN